MEPTRSDFKNLIVWAQAKDHYDDYDYAENHLMDSVRQAVSRTALGFAEYITPVLRQSKFRETGVITPVEFVVAGDFLVHHCPTWQWSGGENSRARSYLPLDKQYLCTKGVPCYKRAAQLVPKHFENDRIVEEHDIDGGWVDTCFITAEDNDAVAMELKEEEVIAALSPSGGNVFEEDISGEGDDDEAEDMDAYIQSGMLDDTDAQTVASRIRQPVATTKEAAPISVTESVDGVLQTRTYDLYITYDKYYQTARFWLVGHDERHRALTEAEMYEDFSQDHVKKTVTMETHPHLASAPMPSIHPCRQADVMRKLMETMAEGGAELGVHQYLLVFLKFVQTVIPTIEYDYTRNFKISRNS